MASILVCSHGLVTLLRELVKVKDLRWIRPFYLYPQQVSDELLDLYAGEEKITKYIDMPLQHINDRMLKRMHRLGDRAASDLPSSIASAPRFPAYFSNGLYRGISRRDRAMFDELRQFMEDTEFDRVAVFLYSDEEDTPAVELDGKSSVR